MRTLDANQLPQPIYPGSAAAAQPHHLQGAPAPVAPPVHHHPGPAPGPAFGRHPGPRRSGRRPYAVVAAVVGALLLVGNVVNATRGSGASGDGAADPGVTPSVSPDVTPADGDGVGAAEQVIRTYLGTIPGGEHDCLVDGLVGQPQLLAGIEAGSFDSSAFARTVAGCVSTSTLAAVVSVNVAAGTNADPTCLQQQLLALDAASWDFLLVAELDFAQGAQADPALVDFYDQIGAACR